MNFLLDNVKPLELDHSAFENLVLPPQQKDLILAFAIQQNEKVQEVDDIIAGKGKCGRRSGELQYPEQLGRLTPAKGKGC